MYALKDKYEELYHKLSIISDELDALQKETEGIELHSSQTIPARIEHLEKQLEKIDEYSLKIQALRKLAEDHITSKNLQTIEAPPNYRVNLNRLRNWSMMIDPMSLDDPYARKLYLVACCDEKFLDEKRKEFTLRVKKLEEELETGSSSQIKAIKERIDSLKRERAQLAVGEELNEFARLTAEANQGNVFFESKTIFAPEQVSAYAPGAAGFPLYFDREQRIYLADIFGDYYDKDQGRVFLPAQVLPCDSEFIMAINCAPSRNLISQLDAGVRNLLLNIIDHSPAGSVRVMIADEERQNTKLAGSARVLQDTFAMEYIPRTPEQMTSMLENIVSSFSDIDELIGDYDTLAEYNAAADDSKKIQRRVLAAVGWPDSFTDADRRLMQRIIANYDRYGISLILIRIHSFKEDRDQGLVAGLSEYASQDIIRIDMTARQTILTVGEGTGRPFMWYPFRGQVSPEYVRSLKENEIPENTVGNEYTQHFNIISSPDYTREYRPIEVPYGIDARGNIHSLNFENENFAAYLVGASRSGKSTLLHTLIAGLIYNYHPDNVELWLADFKQLEFEKYISHLPPHVRYVLLDESTELVYDLIDKLTEKMMERQHLFAQLGKERIDQIDTTLLKEPLPVIFVILDEFSIMSQSLAESPGYKLRLQNLLAKGAALGIRFLFSSQTFTTGIAGLTPTARAQIQQRIAMKGSREEISETLELSSRLKTEQVRNWIDALPPHYTLVKSRKGPDTAPEVNRHLVLYFKDYAERDRMIEMINGCLHAVDSYEPEKDSCYMDKHPVLVDGKNYELFSDQKLMERIDLHRSSGGAFDHEVYVSPGVPRLMTNMKLVTLTEETRENILLLARSAEQACTTSIITSFMRAFLLQGMKVSVWAYGKNRLYRKARNEVWTGSEFSGNRYYVDNDAICDAIRDLKEKIKNRIPGNDLILLLGMDRICSDFEFDSGIRSDSPLSFDKGEYERKKKAREEELIRKGAVVTTASEAAKQKSIQVWIPEKKKREKIYKDQGIPEDEIKKRLAAEAKPFILERYEYFMSQEKSESNDREEVRSETGVSSAAETSHTGAYNAGADFADIVRQGSRLGYHFMMVLNDYSDLRQTMTRIDLYRHRLSFACDVDTSRELFSSRAASSLPEHVCQYSNRMEQFSFRPYIHPGISWEGWYADEDGKLVSPFVSEK